MEVDAGACRSKANPLRETHESDTIVMTIVMESEYSDENDQGIRIQSQMSGDHG